MTADAVSGAVDRPSPVYVSRPLLRTLLSMAAESEPTQTTVQLGTTAADDLDAVDLVDAPVFTHFYFPNAAPSNRAVFGMDLSVPPGQSRGVFVSHPVTPLRVTKRDDLHERVFVAVPPWDESSVAVFDRRGHRQHLRVLDATTPPEAVP
ncbi:MAG: hypothetical protein ABEJ23_04220 [Haloarculaceae archaeon]